ncbi:hypothetical protein AYL99_05196 [Fonsecaea erecta]|uniref:Cytochrome P450 oxidoreductase n=1 Tax=Fonsecaea erecta TaxID=1367422 RepID=A0A178ZK76_9EURO|nr:hypothetical protein AYL99_05196 [Fonsecaea erecta]OAP60194.1 hypothetical protein AYL99_05196 [Fonsecaea erecta]
MALIDRIQASGLEWSTLRTYPGIWVKPTALIAVVLSLACCSYIVYHLFLSPLASIPGPFLARFTNLWWLRVVLRRNVHLETIELHKKYGPLVRIGPNEVSVADLEAFKIIYGAGKSYNKSEFYRPFKAKLKWNLTAEQDEKTHAFNRRQVSQTYSMASTKTLEVYVDHVVEFFLNHLDHKVGQTIDLGRLMQAFAIDSITEISFSKSWGFIEHGDVGGVLALSKAVLASGAWVGVIPWVYDIHQFLAPVIGNWLGATRRSTEFGGMARRTIAEHKEQEHNHRDICSYLQEIRRKKPDTFSEDGLVDVLTSNIFAGSDTTAIALRAMIYYLLTSPHAHKRFLDELHERHKAGLISELARFDEAEAWPYLQAVMYEALRLHPPFAINLPRVVPSGGLVVGETFLPPGTVVGSNAWVIHRQQGAFGDEADKFLPERWLDPVKKAEMQRYFFSFGGGSRTCLGRNIVWLEMSKLLPSLFLRFDIRLTNPTKPMPVKNYFLAFQEGPEVILSSKRKD